MYLLDREKDLEVLWFLSRERERSLLLSLEKDLRKETSIPLILQIPCKVQQATWGPDVTSRGTVSFRLFAGHSTATSLPKWKNQDFVSGFEVLRAIPFFFFYGATKTWGHCQGKSPTVNDCVKKTKYLLRLRLKLRLRGDLCGENVKTLTT